ncbi:MAG: ATP synthase F0 subunit C [Deltaproteobacteria bacterium]|nr:ATP synthase F0 subunit C [Deltaproteobacteria bacterium]MBW2015376.1 ATP synthase F0 subunit C [Deltaproteobacteria bacterium]MBW2128004.1 ATP synthase F0 subunit C [Deltaproteobacteria bacterium]MBW2302583.1 ATP synthase F0 subunit C [Deltaproteobacteria bacterium]
MLESITYIRASLYLGAGLAIGFGAIGAALGEGYAAGKANEALSFRPEKSGDVIKNMLVGQAIAESAAIFALVVSILLLFMKPGSTNMLVAWASIGAGLAMGLSAIGSGVGAGLPAGTACFGIVRQPASSNKILTTMLVGSAVCQTPAIFGMVIAFLLLFLDLSSIPLYPGWAAVFGAGLSTGLSAIGPGIGNGITAMEAVRGVARNHETISATNRTMLVGLGVAQSTAIYGFLISLMLLFYGFKENHSLTSSMALLGAGVCMGFGGIGPGIGEGITASLAVKWIARNPPLTGVLSRTMLVGMAVAESTGIYSLIVALLLIVMI